MLGYHDVNCSICCEVSAGNVESVRRLINNNRPYPTAWSEGYVVLRQAVKVKHTEVAKLLLINGSKVNSKNIATDTPLHFAAINGDIEIVQMLLDRGARIEAINRCGNTPLHCAVKSKMMEITDLLVKSGAYVNARNSEGITPLYLAVETGSEEIVKLLLKHGAYVNSVHNSIFLEHYTPLCVAVQEGHENIVQLLLESGAKVDAQDKDGKTALHFVVDKGHEKFFQLLLEREANVDVQDKDGKTVLHYAVEKRHEKFVQLLLKHGAEVDAEDKCGKTVLHSAVQAGHSIIIDHVLKHCPDVNNKCNRSALNVAVHGCGKEYGMIVEKLLQYGFTVTPEDVNNCKLLHAAVEKGYLKIVEELLKYGIDVNVLYKATRVRGYLPLHVAAINKQEEVAKLLISYGADVNAREMWGRNPINYAVQNADVKITRLLLTNKANVKDNPELLIIAAQKECREIVEDLLQHGADVNACDRHGRTALYFTALGENTRYRRLRFPNDSDCNVIGEIAKSLLSMGANVNAQTENGVTALHAATANGHLAVVKVLLKFGASIDYKDEYGRTALYISTEKAHKKIIIALLEHGADINIMSKDNSTALDVAMDFIDRSDMLYDMHVSDSDDEYYGYDRGNSDDDDEFGDGGGISTREFIAQVLEQHVVKLKTANLYVTKENLQSIRHNYGIIDFKNECKREIARMKREKFSNANVSFYDILTEGTSQLAIYAGNESIMQVLRSGDCKLKFPIYATMINCNFRKGERRKKLLEQGNKVFHFLFNSFPQLPHECTDKILSYLSDEDLRIFIDACKSVGLHSKLEAEVHTEATVLTGPKEEEEAI